jgi:beta-phosphoglucomutase-like phosphatase (HAD superfamily)
MHSHVSLAAIVFDMDGLLLDSERVSQEVLLKAARILGAPLTPEATLKMVGRNAESGYRYLTELFGDERTVTPFLEKAHKLYEAEFEAGRIPLKTGVLQLLDTLDELKIPHAIATSTRRHIAIRKLTKVAIVTRFDHIIGGDDVVNGKQPPTSTSKRAHISASSP